MTNEPGSIDWRGEAEARVLAAFQNAAARVPAYRTLLAQHGVVPGEIKNLRDFEARVPLTGKDALFGRHEIPDLCLDGDMSGAVAGYTSSGYSGTFSFGLETADDADCLRARIDQMLGMFFGAGRRRTLLVNALPMGVKVPAGVATVIDTGLRADAVVAVMKKLGHHFEQVVIVGEHPFLKKIVEDGVDAGLDWKKHVVHLVTGAEVMPENFRRYIAGLLGHDPERPERGQVMVSLGISELGLSLGQETPFCRELRSAALDDAGLRRALFGDAPFLPTFVQWSPTDYWIETAPGEGGRDQLVVTTLDPHRRIPLIRYATSDWARVLTLSDLQNATKKTGHALRPPEVPFPFVAVWGRGRSAAAAAGDGRSVYPEEVKEALYRCAELAGMTTGSFRIVPAGSAFTLRFQLRAGVAATRSLLDAAEGAMARQIGRPLRLELIPFAEWDGGVELSYQRKFQYL